MNLIDRISLSFNYLNQNKKLCLVLVILTTGVFTVTNLHTIYEKETFPDYFDNVKPFLDHCSISKLPDMRGSLKWYEICFSDKIFGNARVIPFLVSIAIIPLAYMFAVMLTRSRFIGLVTITLLVQSPNFYLFSTTATYEQSWVLLLLVSWIIVLKKPQLVLIPFILAIASKSLALIYLPATLLLVKWKNKNDTALITLGFIFAIGIAWIFYNPTILVGSKFDFRPDELVSGLLYFFELINSDYMTGTFLIIVPIGLVMLIQRKVEIAKIPLIFLLTGIFSVPLIQGFTDQLQHAYRLVPFVIFEGIGSGLLLYHGLRLQPRLTKAL